MSASPSPRAWVTPSAQSCCLLRSGGGPGPSKGSLVSFCSSLLLFQLFPCHLSGPTSFLFIKRNKSDLSNLHWPRREGWRLNSFRANGHQDGAWRRRNTGGNFLEGQEGLCGKLIMSSHSESQRRERRGSPFPSLLYCKVGAGACSGVLSGTSSLRTLAVPLSDMERKKSDSD